MVAHRARRRKRASATELYKTCKVAGTCPPDVIPKVEGTTLADRILQWGSLGVYLGGLGIGTGSGTGGRTGYVPVGTRPGTVVDVSIPTRPPVVIEPVGPSDPSIVTLLEESSVINSGATIPTFTGTSGFEITSSATTTPAVLDITPAGDNVVITSTNFNNPLFTEPSLLEIPQTGETSGRVLVGTPTSGVHGYEEIPMDTFATSGTGLEPISSTPVPGVSRVAGPRLYGKALTQVRVSDPAFLTQPSSFVTFDNPVYDPEDETIIFERPSPGTRVPDPDFMDIVKLHRPALTSRRGTVRFSRVGQKFSMRTRSGTNIGARVHYYHDLSPILPTEDIELEPLLPPADPTAEESLYDIYADVDEADMAFTGGGRGATTYGGRITPSVFSSTLSTRYGNVTIPFVSPVDVPLHTGPDIILPSSAQWPFVPVAPADTTHYVYIDGGDYFLWPVTFPVSRKRRRKRLSYFLADGFVAL
ncbi:minor capsid protein L2 [Human papillomavirus 29]|uniref:Minor capsid protein L2 n=1 Tax=Human papillomavirus 29 TaxID=37112 RepID=VL2_HPV29|nr:RecName: Full=Minor capsid protein L2 [Human papillomavirus 29]AAA79434.1 minor capsid protein L2 [Human papillomavirus 29]